ncbi:MAG: thioredoxin domain-containing protein [Kiritimatiellia bacterium]|jgi:tetratricopeptide (TPR) repeat protein/thiol-disulfide isomerase/thioredoxin|nr:redoxin domain-containing protein [Lentisphaerota bacterium]
MMKKPVAFLLLLTLALACAPTYHALSSTPPPDNESATEALVVGAPAPELNVGKWIKGEPIAELNPAQTYVVEFWATWCGPCVVTIPHLTKLAQQFTNVTFIGVNIWERGDNLEDKVSSFVENMGTQMEYRVAMDNTDEFMSKKWMQAAGRRGIPSAFVIHQGKVAWMGHPRSGMEGVLSQISKGDFDPAKWTPQQTESDDLQRKLTEAYNIHQKYLQSVGENGDKQQAAQLSQQFESLKLTSPAILNFAANAILTDARIQHRDIPYATRLAKQAVDSTDGKHVRYLDTYARALWAGGHTNEAIQIQRKALGIEPDNPVIALTLERFLAQMDPGKAAPELKTKRFGALAAAVGSAVYVLGGHSEHGITGSIERFTARTKKTKELPTSVFPRRFVFGAEYDGKIYIAGGTGWSAEESNYNNLTKFEEFNPATGTVRELPDMLVPASRAGAAVVGDKLYIIGGGQTDVGPRLQDVQIFDFKTETWSRGAEMPRRREGIVVAYKGKIYAPGGYDYPSAIRDFQVYDPAKNQWSELPKLPVKTSAHHACVVGNQLYLFGDYAELARTAVYDFKTKTWSLLNIGYKAARHTALAQLGRNVYVIGGNLQSSPPYHNYIQRFTTQQLAQAPRREWPVQSDESTLVFTLPITPRRPTSVTSPTKSPAPSHQASRSSQDSQESPLDPRYFRLKWSQKLSYRSRQYTLPNQIDWAIPQRFVVLTSNDTLFVYRTDNGALAHTIELPSGISSEKNLYFSFKYIFLQDGDQSYVFGHRTFYPITSSTPTNRTYGSTHYQWVCISTNGQLCWQQTAPTGFSHHSSYALPVGPDRNLLLVASPIGFQLITPTGTLLMDTEERCRGTRWMFRLNPSGDGVEAVMIDRQNITCYDVGLPLDSPDREIKLQPRKFPPATDQQPIHPSSSKIDLYSRLLTHSPDNVPLLQWRGMLYALKGDAKPCRRDFDKAVRLAPASADARANYGRALLILGDADEAARQWEQMAELDKSVPASADYRLALAYWAADIKDDALQIFNNAVASYPHRWISREHAHAFSSLWTEKEKAILFELYDAWSHIYTPPASVNNYPLPEPDPFPAAP